MKGKGRGIWKGKGGKGGTGRDILIQGPATTVALRGPHSSHCPKAKAIKQAEQQQGDEPLGAVELCALETCNGGASKGLGFRITTTSMLRKQGAKRGSVERTPNHRRHRLRHVLTTKPFGQMTTTATTRMNGQTAHQSSLLLMQESFLYRRPRQRRCDRGGSRRASGASCTGLAHQHVLHVAPRYPSLLYPSGYHPAPTDSDMLEREMGRRRKPPAERPKKRRLPRPMERPTYRPLPRPRERPNTVTPYPLGKLRVI